LCVLGDGVRVGVTEEDLRAVVKELGVLYAAGEAFEVDVPQRPAEDVDVEAVAALREAAVGRRRFFAGGGAVDAAGGAAHPYAGFGQGALRHRLERAARCRAIVEEQVATI